MKTVFTVSLQSLRVNKRNTCVTFLVMLLSMALLMTICAVWIALIDLQANMLYNKFLKYFPAENLFERVYSNSSYIDVVLIGIMFICITALISGLSIRNVLTLNDGAKAKTLSVLTTLGASKIHRLIYMITDTLFLALVSNRFPFRHRYFHNVAEIHQSGSVRAYWLAKHTVFAGKTDALLCPYGCGWFFECFDRIRPSGSAADWNTASGNCENQGRHFGRAAGDIV